MKHNNNSPKKRSLWLDAWRRLRRNTSAVIGMIMLAIILIVCFTAPLYLDYDEDVIKSDIENAKKFPIKGHLLGTDEIGRDVLARIIWGGRTSLSIGIMSVITSTVVGLILGSLAGYYSGICDTIIMRGLDIFMAIPHMLLMITLVSVMKPTTFNLMLAISLGYIPGSARMAKAQVIKVKNNEYIEAAKGQGASDLWIIMKHILPNAISPLICQYMLQVAGNIMAISGLSFIGLGVQQPQPEWGAMLSAGRDAIRDSWHLTVFPGLAIVITITALTLVGDGLRDALDPRMKR